MGKLRSSRNAWQGGIRPQLRDFAQLLNEQRQLLKELDAV